MKNLIYIFIFTTILINNSCNKEKCPPCFTPPGHFRLEIFDKNSDDLLNPDNNNHYIVKGILLKSNKKLKFKLTNKIGGTKLDRYFIESSLNNDLIKIDNSPCINKECEFYIKYENSNNIDRFNLKIKKSISNFEGCDCTTFSYSYIKYNGKRINQNNMDKKTGAVIIRK